MRLTGKIRDAFRRYYRNRDCQDPEYVWDKSGDIKYIGACLEETGRVTYCEASVGTFLVSWKDGVQTIHDQGNYWREAVFARKKGMRWVKYRDLYGNKLETPEVLD